MKKYYFGRLINYNLTGTRGSLWDAFGEVSSMGQDSLFNLQFALFLPFLPARNDPLHLTAILDQICAQFFSSWYNKSIE